LTKCLIVERKEDAMVNVGDIIKISRQGLWRLTRQLFNVDADGTLVYYSDDIEIDERWDNTVATVLGVQKMRWNSSEKCRREFILLTCDGEIWLYDGESWFQGDEPPHLK
jgi:hypothetical protein